MRLLSVAVIAASLLATPALAGMPFCDGFKAGWVAAFKNRQLAPDATPACPAGSGTTFEAGFEAGMLAALRRIG